MGPVIGLCIMVAIAAIIVWVADYPRCHVVGRGSEKTAGRDRRSAARLLTCDETRRNCG